MAVPYRLLVFTRYPAPGHTKTRLIPQLGADGAAELQRRLTEHTLTTVQDFMTLCQPDFWLQIEIWFTGGSQLQMQTWLGDHWSFWEQGTGDLGDRLCRAFHPSAAAGITRTVAIGIDCPGITAPVLKDAFARLSNHDLVLGPATDGGYYLIGLKSAIPALFSGIAWSTDQVLAQTLAIAQRLNLTVALLDPLSDVDHPEDLWVWQQAQKIVQASSEL